MAETLGGNAALQPRAGRGEQKTVDEVYKETYGILLRFGQVDQVANLAPIWSRLANCATKGEQQSVLQQELTKVCLARGLAPELYCPVVTTGLKQMVTTFNFAGHGGDDLMSGCQPFLVAYTGSGDYYRAQDSAAVAAQLVDQGSTNASLADIRELRSTEKVKMPRDLHQVSLTLQRFAVLAHTLFQGPGNGHTLLVQALWLLANSFQAKKLPLYLERYREVQGTPMADNYPALILRFVQINVQEHLQSVQIGGAVLGYDGGPHLCPNSMTCWSACSGDPSTYPMHGYHYHRRTPPHQPGALGAIGALVDQPAPAAWYRASLPPRRPAVAAQAAALEAPRQHRRLLPTQHPTPSSQT